MRPSNWQAREAARIGNNRAVESIVTHWIDDLPVVAYDTASERRAREVRRENIRRTALAA